MKIITFADKVYRIESSTIKTESMRKAYLNLGILDEVVTYPPRTRKRYVILFIMTDGSARLADNVTRRKAIKLAKTYK